MLSRLIFRRLNSTTTTTTAAAKAPLPIVICGRSPQVSSAVTRGLLPDYTVAHIILSPEAGVRNLPGFLRRGAGNPTPVAVLIGGGYTDEDLNLMKVSCRGVPPIIWLKARQRDMTGPLPPFAEYGMEIGGIARAVLNDIRSRGELSKGQTYYL
ncbi:hypothetical protein BJY01DRAFT_222910 [Aspergillus pseudoustus]|uniref:Uncharacterized protein n=1 Tax=Aspergillus pseudoustus TaxID=1810923 RepID=A0ABR4J756_9EURO